MIEFFFLWVVFFVSFFSLLTDWTEAGRAYTEAAGCVEALPVP